MTSNNEPTGPEPEQEPEQITLDGDPATHPTLTEVRRLMDEDAPPTEVIDAAFTHDEHDAHSITFDGMTIADFARMNETFAKSRMAMDRIKDMVGDSDDGFIQHEIDALQGYIDALQEQAPDETDELMAELAEYTREHARQEQAGGTFALGAEAAGGFINADDLDDDEEPRGYQ